MIELWLVRHGETEWSASGAHTGRTDLPLTPHGVEQARALGRLLKGVEFSMVLTSPLRRARDTARLVGLGDAQVEPDLVEWDYGDYEGRTTIEIRQSQPAWTVWDGAIPNGETLGQVRDRAARVIERVSDHGRVAIFGHGHMLRILAATWLGLPPEIAKHLVLDTASLSRLGEDRKIPAILRWNISAEPE